MLLWKEIKGKKLGYEFHRQVPIDQYIVDFFCHELMLAIEIDGSSHDSEEVQVKDLDRQSEMEGFGVSFLRFDDLDVKRNLKEVVRSIEEWIENFEKTSP